MNTDIKTRWVAALRSGEYEQGKGGLLNDGRYCCLGVLCDLAVQDGVIEQGGDITVDGYVPFGPDNEETFLPHAVADWAELAESDRSDPQMKLPEEYEDGWMSLSDLNDNLDFTFEQIAALVEDQL